MICHVRSETSAPLLRLFFPHVAGHGRLFSAPLAHDEPHVLHGEGYGGLKGCFMANTP
jgi:hypothetical protein